MTRQLLSLLLSKGWWIWDDTSCIKRSGKTAGHEELRVRRKIKVYASFNCLKDTRSRSHIGRNTLARYTAKWLESMSASLTEKAQRSCCVGVGTGTDLQHKGPLSRCSTALVTAESSCKPRPLKWSPQKDKAECGWVCGVTGTLMDADGKRNAAATLQMHRAVSHKVIAIATQLTHTTPSIDSREMET